jgi:outer membrane protein TolC
VRINYRLLAAIPILVLVFGPALLVAQEGAEPPHVDQHNSQPNGYEDGSQDDHEHGFEHAHQPLPVDEGMSLAQTIDEAVAAWPRSVEMPARQAQAAAWSKRGDSLLSDRPSFSFRYQTDQFNSDEGMREYEAGILLPLWNWGGRDATSALGDAFNSESEAVARALRWQVAGEVRRVLWRIALAVNDYNLVTQAQATAQQIADRVSRSHELGEVALRDVLMSQSALLEARTVVIEASAVLLDAEREFRSVAGIDRRPAFKAETISELHEVSEDHPALIMVNAEIARAEAEYAMLRKTFSSNPHLLVGPRRERAPLASDYDDSIGVTMTVPFGGSSHRDVELAAADRRIAEVQAKRLEQQRFLTLQLHEAAHSLDVVRQNIDEAAERMSLATRQQEMGQSAYEKGELDLIDLLKLQEITLAAKRHFTQLQIEQNRQTAFYNQAVGELP